MRQGWRGWLRTASNGVDGLAWTGEARFVTGWYVKAGKVSWDAVMLDGLWYGLAG